MYSYVLKIIQKELCKSKKKLKVQISISINYIHLSIYLLLSSKRCRDIS